MLCDKVEGQRWCGTKLGVKDGVCERGCVSKMVCERSYVTKACVKDGVGQRWCVKDGVCVCVTDGV